MIFRRGDGDAAISVGPGQGQVIVGNQGLVGRTGGNRQLGGGGLGIADGERVRAAHHVFLGLLVGDAAGHLGRIIGEADSDGDLRSGGCVSSAVGTVVVKGGGAVPVQDGSEGQINDIRGNDHLVHGYLGFGQFQGTI